MDYHVNGILVAMAMNSQHCILYLKSCPSID